MDLTQTDAICPHCLTYDNADRHLMSNGAYYCCPDCGAIYTSENLIRALSRHSKLLHDNLYWLLSGTPAPRADAARLIEAAQGEQL